MTEMTPSLIDVDLDDAKPLRVLPDNTEKKVTIKRAQLDKSKAKDESLGVYNLHLWLDTGESDVDDVQVWIPVPNSAWKEYDFKDWQKAVNRFKEFCQACSFSPPITSDRLVGLSGWVILGVQEDQRNAGQFQNQVKGWQVK